MRWLLTSATTLHLFLSFFSDVLLCWMLEEARSVPAPLIIDDAGLNVFPDPTGVQHDKIADVADTVQRRTSGWLRWRTRSITCKARARQPRTDATMHPSVA